MNVLVEGIESSLYLEEPSKILHEKETCTMFDQIVQEVRAELFGYYYFN